MKKVLLIEDDLHFVKIVESFLQRDLFDIDVVHNGIDGLKKLEKNTYDVIISDINMPYMDGIEFAKKLRTLAQVAPLILISGSPNPFSSEMLKEIGIEDFLRKPFKQHELLEAVEGISSKYDFVVGNKDFPYARVPLNCFISRNTLDFDLFIRLNSEKIIKIGQAGDELPRSRIEVYNSKNVKYLFVKKSDIPKVNKFNQQIIDGILKKTDLNQSKKIKLMNYSAEVVLDQVRSLGRFDEKTMEESLHLVNSVVKNLENQANTVNIVEALSEYSDWLFAHSFGVSYMMVLLAKELGYFSDAEIKKIGLIGLLHDIGISEMDIGLLNKPIRDLTQQDRKVYDRHSMISRDYISMSPDVPKVVLEAVLNHHNSEDKKISPIVKKYINLLEVSDYFIYHTIKNPMYEQYKAVDVIQKIVNGNTQPRFSIEMRNVMSKINRRVA